MFALRSGDNVVEPDRRTPLAAMVRWALAIAALVAALKLLDVL